MSYRPENQFRCTIIRGKSQSEMEDLLPFYVQTVHKYCPCTKEEFDNYCNNSFAKHFYSSESYSELSDANKKTIRNHITEIMGKLFGLYIKTKSGFVKESETCLFLYEKNDFPAFFKNLCLNLQFPNCADSLNTIKEKILNRIKIRPLTFIVKLFSIASTDSPHISKQEIGYYVLNNLDVLQGEVSEQEVWNRILEDRANGVRRNKLTGSYEWQHIKEMLNLLELSNIIESDAEDIWLNYREKEAIELFNRIGQDNLFDVYKYNLDDEEDKKQLSEDWDEYYGHLHPAIENIETKFGQPITDDILQNENTDTGKPNDENDFGEDFVYKKECERIKAYKEKLISKVVLLGRSKRLGYNICSIEADEDINNPELERYINVKSTTRVTEPKFDENWTDYVNLSTKEWIAAEQYREVYYIYRVYFTKTKVIVMKIKNPYEKSEKNEIAAYATNYKLDFGASVLTKQYEDVL